jgi:hypothetical protein
MYAKVVLQIFSHPFRRRCIGPIVGKNKGKGKYPGRPNEEVSIAVQDIFPKAFQ